MEIEEAYAEPTQPVLEHSTSTKSIMKTNKAGNQTWVRRIRNCQKQRKKEKRRKRRREQKKQDTIKKEGKRRT